MTTCAGWKTHPKDAVGHFTHWCPIQDRYGQQEQRRGDHHHRLPVYGEEQPKPLRERSTGPMPVKEVGGTAGKTEKVHV